MVSDEDEFVYIHSRSAEFFYASFPGFSWVVLLLEFHICGEVSFRAF